MVRTPGERRSLRPQGETRTTVLTVIQDQPGIHVRAVPGACNMAQSTAIHHIQNLLEEGDVVAYELRGRKFLFHRDVQPIERLRVAALSLPESSAILEALRTEPGGIMDLQRRLQLSRKRVRHRLEILSEAGLIHQRGLYRPQFSVTETGQAVLQDDWI